LVFIALMGLALAAPAWASAMTQAELNAECTRIWGPPDHHYTPNGCVKGKLVVSNSEANKQVAVKTPLTDMPVDGPAGISDQAAAGNLSSFLHTKVSDTPCKTTRAGALTVAPKGCWLMPGQDSACLKAGGALADSGSKRFCIPRGLAK
jgi:hypothetical protein